MKLLYVIRQRCTAVLWAFVLCAAIYFLYVYFGAREYSATAQVQGFFPQTNDAAAASARNTAGRDDFAAQLHLLESTVIAKGVEAALTDPERQHLMAPYTNFLHLGTGPSVGELLLSQRVITPDPASLIMEVTFRHPDPALAARVANAFANEYLKQNQAKNDENLKSLIGDLQTQAAVQRKKIDEIQSDMQALIDKYNLSNLDDSTAAVFVSATQELNKTCIQNKTVVDELTIKHQLMLQQQQDGKPMWDLPFIAQQPRIAAMIKTVHDLQDEIVKLRSEQYPEDAPDMQVAKGSFTNAINDLAAGTDSVMGQIESDLTAAQANYQQSLNRLDEMQKKTQELSKTRAEYEALHSDRDAAEKIANSLAMTISQQQTNFKLAITQYSLLQQADVPTKPNPLPVLSTALTCAGCGLGGSLFTAVGFLVFRPPPSEQREEYERRRRRHRHFHSSKHRSSSSSSKSSREK